MVGEDGERRSRRRVDVLSVENSIVDVKAPDLTS